MSTLNRANSFSAYADFLMGDKKVDTDILKYYIIDYYIPGSTLSGNEISAGGKSGTIPGDTVVPDQSQVLRFIIDEDLKVYFALRDIQKKNSLGFYNDLLNMQIMNNKTDVIANAVYQTVWIFNIGPIRYSTTENETTTYIDVTINYLDFDIQPV